MAQLFEIIIWLLVAVECTFVATAARLKKRQARSEVTLHDVSNASEAAEEMGKLGTTSALSGKAQNASLESAAWPGSWSKSEYESCMSQPGRDFGQCAGARCCKHST